MRTASRPRSFSPRAFARVFDDSDRDVRSKVIALYVFLGVFNVAGWVLAFTVFSSRPLLLGTALLAYTFGLRHAVDADHISAIDNVTRKLMQDGKRPVGVGFFFSLGHSTVVVALTVGIAVAATAVKHTIPHLQNIGGLIGTSVSATFLYVIAIINLLVLVEIVRAFRGVRRGEGYDEQSIQDFLDQRGLMGRFFKPLLRIVSRSVNMYPIGFLFGLGFDTATEVGLLGIAAVEAGKGLPIYAILIFPLLFTAGMALIDTSDSILMLGAYGWAFVKPIRKLYYNMTITLVSVLVAFVVGTIEALSIVAGQLNLRGGMWTGIDALSNNFGALGYIIVGIFVVSWGASTLLYRLRRYDETEMPPARLRPIDA
ncbi:MAG: HoxN/HupN/NixA family nickel/cobalt transporter [Candidatus Eremiobacteraeota bacterium]|nr:HoxN/HupN/NixA family nickel/cobalt transporter [Candidatus Eremiobacteraeota bacterium]